MAERLDNDLIYVCAGWNGHESVDTVDVFKYDKNADTIWRVDN